MSSKSHAAMRRREFLKLAGAAAALGMGDTAWSAQHLKIDILINTGDPLSSAEPVRWAVEKLHQSLIARSAASEVLDNLNHSEGRSLLIVIAAAASKLASAAPPNAPESFQLTPGKLSGTDAIFVSAGDPLGYVYALLELSERVQYSNETLLGLLLKEAHKEAPANEVRSMARAFLSEIEDKAWYYDKDFWHRYLDALAYSRFNRFNFALGFGYDFPRGVTGDYFHFPYPYLVDVPGYKVRVVPLADGEQQRNLEMLRFIAAETAARGLQFQLGLWTHAYAWTDSPHADHRIDGLTAETHAPYCRDALAMLLKVCPQIQGLTMRVHGESGIPEGSYPFWKTLFEAIPASGRKIEIDMHAKGINQIMIDMATATGMPVKVSPKYSAEHQSLGYHQADIRELEIPTPGHVETGIFSVSGGERKFTRYGYADLYQQDRKFDILFRLWPGTQRHLLWGDPETAAAYGRTAHFCGASGLEICEPLTFKGREGSGQPGGRCAYADETLGPKTIDWKKFEYTYRIWGRLLYNPETNPEAWRRYLRSDFGDAANSVESAIGNASRILPLLTSAHLPSASNHSFWPEIYDNMPIVSGSEPSPYGDTPTPKLFGTVSPLDPQLFSTINEHAHDLLATKAGAKYSPVEVAQWLENFSAASGQSLAAARRQAASPHTASFRRMEEDVLILNGLGLFFAAKLRSGVLFEIWQQTGSPEAGKQALSEYQKARTAWATMADRANHVYRADISYGEIPMRRGHWSDRLPNIDRDLAAMQEKLKEAAAGGTKHDATREIRAVMQPPPRPQIHCTHTAPLSFQPGQPLLLSLGLPTVNKTAIQLRYRHVNQGERWQTAPMEREQQTYKAAIPATYTDSVYPLQYYFELTRGTDTAWFWPAFNQTLSSQPYYAVFKRSV